MVQISRRPETTCAEQEEETSRTRQGQEPFLPSEDRITSTRYRIAASAAVWKNLAILQEYPDLTGEGADPVEKLALCHPGCMPHLCKKAIVLHRAGKALESQAPGESAFLLDPSLYRDHCRKLTWIDTAVPGSEPEHAADPAAGGFPDDEFLHQHVDYGTYVDEAYDE